MESYSLRTLSRADVYSSIIEIGNQENLDLSDLLSEVMHSEDIPYKAIAFINHYKPLPQLMTYNSIYEKKNKNPLYRNIVNESLPTIERAIALSSLLTRSIITMKSLPEEDHQAYANIMNIPVIAEAISRYTNYGDSDMLDEVFMMVRDVFKNLYG